jgi:PAS domain S-box-containing protein
MPDVLDPEIYRSVLEGLPTGVYLTDRDRKILFWNDGAERITGYLRHEVIGRSCFDNFLMHCDESNSVLCGSGCPLAATIHDGSPRLADLFLLHKNGQRVPVHVHAAPIRDAGGVIIGATETFEERVLRPGAESHPSMRVFRDSNDDLTGVLDGPSLEKRLAATLEDFCEDHVPFGVLSMQIDGLEELGKFHGKHAIESILRVTGQTLLKSVGPSDAVGRRGENVFVIIATACPAASLKTVAVMMQRIVSRASVSWWGDHLSIALSAGGTAAREVDTVDVLLDRSEKALRMGISRDGDHVIIV